MIVITLTACPTKLRGDLTKWMQEIDTGVFIGKLSARVRDELWNRIQESIGNGRATMCFTAKNAQGYMIRTLNTEWYPVEYDGLTLMKHRLKRPNVEIKGNADSYKRKKNASQNKLTVNLDGSEGRELKGKGKKKKAKDPINDAYVIIDLETTGLDPAKDQIIELAALRVINHEIVESYSQLIRIDQTLDETIVQLTGITNELLDAKGVCASDAVEEFMKFVGNEAVISHNSKFDLAFLNELFARTGHTKFTNRCEDTLKLSRKYLKNVDNYRLSTLAQYFQIDTSGAHRALPDSMITMQLFEKLNEIAGGTL